MSSIPAGNAVAPTTQLRQLRPGSIPRPPRKPLYDLLLWLVAVLSCLIPLAYLGLVAGLAWLGVHYYLEWAPRSGHGMLRLVGWTAPGFIIGVLVVFLLKPFFAPRTRAPEPVRLEPEQDPGFTAAVHALCAAIGIRPPRAIHLTHQVNAWVQFVPGPAGLLGGARTLTIGLPLVAGMSARELVGVLAHEFGHFAQRGGMRAAHLINRVNYWLESRAYQDDAWDGRLRRWLEDEEMGGIVHLTCLATLACLWATRLLLRGMFQLSFRMSRRLSQEMEFDADRYEATVAGSEAFAATALRMRALEHAWHEVDRLNRKAWGEGRLVDDLPGATAQRLQQWGRQDWESVEAQLQSDDTTRYWDSHPADQARIANAQALQAPGIFRDDRPAAALFADFPALCRQVTAHYYAGMELDYGPRQLIGAAELLGRGRLADATAAAWQRYTNGMLGSVPLLDPAGAGLLPAAAFDWQGSVDELRRLGPEATGLWQRLDRLRERADALALWIALLDQEEDFVMPDGSPPDPGALRAEYGACVAADTPDLRLARRILAVFARRLRHAVDTLEGAARDEAEARLALLARMHAHWPELARTLQEARVCMRMHAGMGSGDEVLRPRVHARAERCREQVGALLGRLDDAVPGSGQPLGQLLLKRCGHYSSAGADPFAFARAVLPLEDAFLDLYRQQLAALVETADLAERTHGIRPIRLFAAPAAVEA